MDLDPGMHDARDMRDLLHFQFRHPGQTVLLTIAYGLIPLLFILERCGLAYAGRYLYESLYLCICIAIVAAMVYELTVSDLVKNVLCACGVVFLELSAVAYIGLLTEQNRRIRPLPSVEPVRYQQFQQFQQFQQQNRSNQLFPQPGYPHAGPPGLEFLEPGADPGDPAR